VVVTISSLPIALKPKRPATARLDMVEWTLDEAVERRLYGGSYHIQPPDCPEAEARHGKAGYG
jgi:hypothetical protein